METARAAAERRWRNRNGWAFGLIGAALFLTVGAVGPIDRPGEAIAVAILAGLVGFVLGKEAGRRQRRFLPLRGRGPRISQSMTGQERSLYQSHDTLEHRFQLTEAAVCSVALHALATTPFVGYDIADVLDLPRRAQYREAMWLFQTHDSAGHPIFLDAGGILGMLEFTSASADCEELRRALLWLAQLRQVDNPRQQLRAAPDTSC